MHWGKLRVQTYHPESGATLWLVVDADGEQVARFDSRGGYNEGDAQQFADTENGRVADDNNIDPMLCRSCGCYPCAQWCGADERS
jgi:hypothetical protein